jgi:hypothetical protein
MTPRFIVQRPQGDDRYSVWDNKTNRLAVSESRECAELVLNASGSFATLPRSAAQRAGVFGCR